MNKLPAVLAAALLGAAGFTAAAIASGKTDTTPTTTTGGKPAKVALCHHTGSKKHPLQTITVAQPAVKAHLRHHDELGVCPTPTATTTTTSDDGGSTGHGKGKGHGKP